MLTVLSFSTMKASVPFVKFLDKDNIATIIFTDDVVKYDTQLGFIELSERAADLISALEFKGTRIFVQDHLEVWHEVSIISARSSIRKENSISCNGEMFLYYDGNKIVVFGNIWWEVLSHSSSPTEE